MTFITVTCPPLLIHKWHWH